MDVMDIGEPADTGVVTGDTGGIDYAYGQAFFDV